MTWFILAPQYCCYHSNRLAENHIQPIFSGIFKDNKPQKKFLYWNKGVMQ